MDSYTPATIWLTGLPSSGKSTLGSGLGRKLRSVGVGFVLLDGDEVRSGVCSDLGFSDDDRRENIRRVAHIAKLLNDQGFVAICCLVSPLQSMRDLARSIVGNRFFYEVFVNASLATCMKRDVKGLYAKAEQGQLTNLTGFSAAYENPSNPNLILQNNSTGVEEAVNTLFAHAVEWLNITK
jgi:adenylylsulfate kinase